MFCSKENLFTDWWCWILQDCFLVLVCIWECWDKRKTEKRSMQSGFTVIKNSCFYRDRFLESSPIDGLINRLMRIVLFGPGYSVQKAFYNCNYAYYPYCCWAQYGPLELIGPVSKPFFWDYFAGSDDNGSSYSCEISWSKFQTWIWYHTYICRLQQISVCTIFLKKKESYVAYVSQQIHCIVLFRFWFILCWQW